MADAQPPRRFLAPEAERVGEVVTLGLEASRHLATVLRVGPGQSVRVFNGRGREFLARVEQVDAAGARVRLCEAWAAREPLPARLTVAFAPPPGPRADLLIEKATELGASCFVPVLCARLQGFQAAAAARRLERWRRKARDAARQSERTSVPDVRAPCRLDEFLRADESALRLIGCPGDAPALWDVLTDAAASPPASVTMLVGPAGGFTRGERELAGGASFRAVSLGPHVLRVETAALAMLAGVALWAAAKVGPPSCGAV